MKNGIVYKKITWQRLVEAISIILVFVGFWILLQSVGAIENSTNPIAEDTGYVLQGLLGLTLLVIGSMTASVMNSHQSFEDSEEDVLPDTEEKLIGAMAYNRDYHSWMVIVSYKNDQDWAFVLCSRTGRPKSAPIRTRRNLINYEWTI